MSETQEGATLTRRPRADRQVHREDAPRVSIESGDDNQGPPPEAALADVRAQLQARDREVAEARRQAQDEARRRQQVEQARQGDHRTAVAAAVEAAKADESAAEAAALAAREAGDFKTELDAMKRLSSASYRLTQATAELAALKDVPSLPQHGNGQQQQQQEWRPSDASRRWLDAHPRFYADPAYKSHVEAMDKAAYHALGPQAYGTQQYVDWIEERMVEKYGADHGEVPVARPAQRERQAPRGGDSIAPSSGSSRMGGWRTVRYGLGDLLVQDRSDGSRGIRFASRDAEENFREGAKVNMPGLYERDPGKALADYCEEAIKAYDEGMPELKIGDGRSYRSDEE